MKSKPTRAAIEGLERANETLRGKLVAADSALGFEKQRAAKLEQDAARAAQALADKDRAIGARDADIRHRDSQIAALAGERDRIMRVVDQFTSVEIRASQVPGNSPKELRRT